MKPLNYYMSEVEAPPEIERILSNPLLCVIFAEELVQAIKTHSYPRYAFEDKTSKAVADWMDKQSGDTWVRVLRWLAMEVI